MATPQKSPETIAVEEQILEIRSDIERLTKLLGGLADGRGDPEVLAPEVEARLPD